MSYPATLAEAERWYAGKQKTQASGPSRAAGLVLLGADDEIRTRDPHLGKKKVTQPVRTVRLTRCSAPQSAEPSGKSVWSVQFVYRSTIARALFARQTSEPLTGPVRMPRRSLLSARAG